MKKNLLLLLAVISSILILVLFFITKPIDEERIHRLADHISVDVTKATHWTVTWEKSLRGGLQFCRAVGYFPRGIEVTIIFRGYDKNSSNADWYLSITDYKLKLPERSEIPVRVETDQKTIASGKLDDIVPC